MRITNGLPFAVVLVLTQVLHAGYVEEVLNDSPVAYWRLGEEDIDQPIIDITGNVEEGEYFGGAGLETGFPGAIVGDDNTSVQFSTTPGFGCGDCGQGQLPVGGVLDLGTLEDATMTLEAWFQILPSVNDSLPPSHFNRLFHYNNFDGGQYAFGIVGDNSAGFPGQRTVFAGVGSGLEDGQGDQGIILAAESDAIPPSDDPVWHHLVAHIEQEDVRLFLDGEHLEDLTDSDPIFWQAPQATIGGRAQNNGSFVHPFPGLIDELAIYNSILPPARIQAHYMAGLGQAPLGGDYNNDGAVDATDIDLQGAAMKDPNANLATFDENTDGVVDGADRLVWVKDHAKTWVGDADLDGEFNSGDFVVVFTAGKSETGEMAGWAEGDWDGNMLFDSGDFVAAFTDGGYELGPLPAVSAVPEPSAAFLFTVALLGSALLRRRTRRV